MIITPDTVVPRTPPPGGFYETFQKIVSIGGGQGQPGWPKHVDRLTGLVSLASLEGDIRAFHRSVLHPNRKEMRTSLVTYWTVVRLLLEPNEDAQLSNTIGHGFDPELARNRLLSGRRGGCEMKHSVLIPVLTGGYISPWISIKADELRGGVTFELGCDTALTSQDGSVDAHLIASSVTALLGDYAGQVWAAQRGIMPDRSAA
jgi:hypothetical protein